jgi:ankyrin repeat domain-containing protein 50
MSNKIERRLKQLLKDSPLDFDELSDLIEDVFAVSQEQFIVIDALDECEKADRKLLLSALRRLINASKVKLKIFLTSGPHIGIELERTLRPNFHISMTSPEVNSDIKSYIEDEITQKKENGDLVVGQSQLITEIQDTLVRGAQGM